MSQLIGLSTTQIIVDNFKYQFDSRQAAKTRHFNCVFNKECKCQATIDTDLEMKTIVRKKDSHNHLAMFPVESELLIEINSLKIATPSLCMTEIKRRYSLIYEQLSTKYGRILLNPFWKDWSRMNSTFKKILVKHQGSTLAKSASEIQLAPQLSKISNDKPFLREYNSQSSSPFMLLLSDEGKECLSKANQWDFDGTFNATPSVFKQIFDVIGIYKEVPIRCGYLLLFYKEQTTYEKAIKSLLKHTMGPEEYENVFAKKSECKLAITTASADFENGIQNAIHIAFEGIKEINIKGCWFHFRNAIVKRLNQDGLQQRYVKDQAFRLWVKYITTLPITPLENLQEAWDIILDEVPHNNEKIIFDFITYFINTWLKGRYGSHLIPSIWNRYEDYHKTEGNNEVLHRRMNQNLSAHSQISTIIDFFNIIDNEASHKFYSVKNNTHKPEPKTTIDIEYQEKLEIIQQSFREKKTSFKDYFKQLAHHRTFGRKKPSCNPKTNNEEIIDITKDTFEFDNPFKNIPFASRLDYNNKKINSQTAQPAQLTQPAQLIQPTQLAQQPKEIFLPLESNTTQPIEIPQSQPIKRKLIKVSKEKKTTKKQKKIKDVIDSNENIETLSTLDIKPGSKSPSPIECTNEIIIEQTESSSSSIFQGFSHTHQLLYSKISEYF